MSTFSFLTTTSSKVIPLVSEHLCPIFFSFLPGVTPGVSRYYHDNYSKYTMYNVRLSSTLPLSTMNPVKALLEGHLGSGSVLASTK